MKLSIRQRLLLWLLPALLVAGIVAGFATWLKAREEVSELFDNQLQQIALSLLHPLTTHLPLPPGDDDDASEQSDFVSRIWDRNGIELYTSRPAFGLPRSAISGFATHDWQHQAWRTYTLINRHRTVEVAQSLHDRDEVATAMASRLLGPQLLLFVFLAALIWVGVGRGLLPLGRITAALRERTPQALEPLAVRALPVEIMPLVTALNDLLQRLANALCAQRQFIEDAAHELRTPLTAVRLQAQLLARTTATVDRQSALQQLQHGIDRATHLTRQLLTLARVEPDAAQDPGQALALDRLITQVLLDHALVATEKNIDLGVIHIDAVTMRGDAESLRILFGNLIDNAIRYTPEGGAIDVSLSVNGATVTTEISDTGCGIAIAERSRVFDRFYRSPGTGAAGSGLGLAIVKAIVERHRGNVTLTGRPDIKGLTVTVSLPLGAAPLSPRNRSPGQV